LNRTEEPASAPAERAPRPYTLVAELTYRCALRCPYCSNPVDHARRTSELDAAQWLSVFVQAEELGVVQVHLTGGEPLARRDLEALVAGAHACGLFTNLITSGVPLVRERLVALQAAGLDAVQLSVQDVDAESCNRIAGYDCFDLKVQVARWVRELGLPLTLNVVLHRDNIDCVAAAIELAERLGAHRVELANTQYLGWALAHRDALLPTRERIDRARAVAHAARQRLEGRMDVLFVMPDYHSGRPRACMDGWGRRFVDVTPDGTVLPCQSAQSIPGLSFDRVVEGRTLREAWERSPGMRAFRGDAWMIEPCRSCAHKAVDFGGCRCQAYLLTGDAAAADPACDLSPHHGLVAQARLASRDPAPRRLLYRGHGS
jgi:pyrroloquinoline quinone biosynthesis protein E